MGSALKAQRSQFKVLGSGFKVHSSRWIIFKVRAHRAIATVARPIGVLPPGDYVVRVTVASPVHRPAA